MTTRLPCFADIEASGLGPESYPIELGWSLPTGEIRSSLIRPAEVWGDHWEEAAEDLHGIGRLQLEVEGKSPVSVAALMNSDLAGHVVYFDGGDYDRRWLDQLFDAARMRPAFKFGDFDVLLVRAAKVGAKDLVLAEALALADISDLPLHRAANDVRLMQRLYIRTREGMPM